MSLDSRACIEYSLIETIVGQKHWKTKNRLILQCSCNYCQIFGVWARLAGRKKRPRKRARAISLSFPPKNELQWPDTYFSMRFAAMQSFIPLWNANNSGCMNIPNEMSQVFSSMQYYQMLLAFVPREEFMNGGRKCRRRHWLCRRKCTRQKVSRDGHFSSSVTQDWPLMT